MGARGEFGGEGERQGVARLSGVCKPRAPISRWEAAVPRAFFLDRFPMKLFPDSNYSPGLR